jgi:RimJ/RimL family protein N-acetyltransferase
MTYLLAPERYEAEGFVLRSYHPGDGPLLAEATNASYDHLKRFMPWAKPHQTDEEAEILARQFRGRWLLAQDFVLAIVSPDGQRLLGGCGYHLREGDLSQSCAEVGMWIRASAAGQGLGTQALRALLRWGLSDAWPWTRVTWRSDEANLASQRTALRAGMEHEGFLRDLLTDHHGQRVGRHCYAALRGRWRDPIP